MAAQRRLERLSQEADAAGHWQEERLTEELSHVADYTRRIMYPGATIHYRAAKAGALLAAALRVQRAAMMGYGECGPAVVGDRGLADLAAERRAEDLDADYDRLEEITAAVVSATWGVARGWGFYKSDAADLQDVLGRMVCWASDLYAAAEDDPA